MKVCVRDDVQDDWREAFEGTEGEVIDYLTGLDEAGCWKDYEVCEGDDCIAIGSTDHCLIELGL